jgi:predicted ATPase
MNILVGPNASGKSTLLDVFGFIRDALETDVEYAVRQRGTDLRELAWNHELDKHRGFQLALEVNIPAHLRIRSSEFDKLRYELEIGLSDAEGIVVTGENLWLINSLELSQRPPSQISLFPEEPNDHNELLRPARSKTPSGYQLIIRKVAEGNDYFKAEQTKWNIMFRFAPNRLALAGVPEDQDRFPISLWFKNVLRQNLQILQLNSSLMRSPSPSDASHIFQPDGSNLPIMVEELKEKDAKRFRWWIGHLQTILEDLEDVTVEERPENRSRYLNIIYRNGLKVPAWMLSDGTLRLLALTLIAYLPHQEQIFLIEEPENGLYPKAIESVYKALASVYDSQIFLATHSPLFIALAEPDNLLIFAKTASGATDVVRGSSHPMLKDWRKEEPLETLFAAGVLG